MIKALAITKVDIVISLEPTMRSFIVYALRDNLHPVKPHYHYFITNHQPLFTTRPLTNICENQTLPNKDFSKIIMVQSPILFYLIRPHLYFSIFLHSPLSLYLFTSLHLHIHSITFSLFFPLVLPHSLIHSFPPLVCLHLFSVSPSINPFSGHVVKQPRPIALCKRMDGLAWVYINPCCY